MPWNYLNKYVNDRAVCENPSVKRCSKLAGQHCNYWRIETKLANRVCLRPCDCVRVRGHRRCNGVHVTKMGEDMRLALRLQRP